MIYIYIYILTHFLPLFDTSYIHRAVVMLELRDKILCNYMVLISNEKILYKYYSSIHDNLSNKMYYALN